MINTTKSKSNKGTSSYTLNRRVEQTLDDLVKYAYPDLPPEELKQALSFHVQISTKKRQTFSGRYDPNNGLIYIFNLHLGMKHVAKCCLHELSHHIDYVQHHKTDHQESFYKIYKRLIYTACDMGILSPADFYDSWSADGKKVEKIIESYKPHPIPYQPSDAYLIKIQNAYEYKDKLKMHGYRWNNVEQVWEKPTNDPKQEEIFLKKIGLPSDRYYVSSTHLYVDAVVFIKACGDTYNAKKSLQANGFSYNPEKKEWTLKQRRSQIPAQMKKLRSVPSLQQNLTFQIIDG